MQGFLDWIAQPYAMLAVVVVVLLALIIPLYVRFSRQKHAMEDRLASMETLFGSGLSELKTTTSTERAADREEMAGNLRGMSDSVVRIMGEMSRTQQQQLDSFGGQIRAMSRTDEERMERMRVNIEEKLQEYDRQMSRVSQTLDEKLAVNERRLAEMR